MLMTQEWKEYEEEEKLVSQDIVKLISNEFPRSTLARKGCRYCNMYPYRKPTQVDEERILR